jgi:hypothetical protein
VIGALNPLTPNPLPPALSAEIVMLAVVEFAKVTVADRWDPKVTLPNDSLEGLADRRVPPLWLPLPFTGTLVWPLFDALLVIERFEL